VDVVAPGKEGDTADDSDKDDSDSAADSGK
jgi:hypothetical protein